MEEKVINILIVEDNPADVRLIVEMFKECVGSSFKVSPVDRIDKALKALKNEKFDVVLLDFNLPDNKGLDGLEKITAQTPLLPVILLTGVDDEKVGIQVLQKKAADYLVKGQINSTILVRSIRYAMERKHFEAALVREKENLQKIFDSVNVGMLIVDDKGIVRQVNETVSQWVGKDASDCLSDQPGNILRCVHAIADPKGCGYTSHCGGCPIRDSFESVLRTGKPVHGIESESILVLKGEKLNLWFEINSDPIILDGKQSVVMALNNITERKQAEEESKVALDRFYLALSNLTFGALLVGEDGRIEFANQLFCDIFYLKESPSDLIKLTSSEVIKKIKRLYSNPEDAVARIMKIVAQGKPVIDEDVLMKGNRTFLRDFIPLRLGEKKQGRLWIHKEITERKKMEDDLQKSNRILKALSRSSEELIRASSESGYLRNICSILVKDCDYKMAWVGFAETDDAKTVSPFVQAGFEKGYLETAGISWADNERGRGPTGTCIRTGKPVICRDMLIDPAFAPWRKEALKRGYASSIALPLIANEKPFGSITLYSAYPDPFSEEEVKLLLQLVDDISYGIAVLRLRESQVKAEEETEKAHVKTKLILESITEAYIVFDRQGRFVDVNRCAEDLLGKKTEELKGRTFKEVFPKVKETEFYRRFRKALVQNKDLHFEAFSSLVGKWFETHVYPFPAGLTVYLHDISQRKTVEEALRETKDYLNNLIDHASAPIIVWNPDFRIVRFNQAFEFISGYEFSEVIGEELSMLFPEERRDESLGKIERTLKGEQWDAVEVPVLCKDGSVRLLLWNSANIYVKNKKLMATIAQGQDITDRKKAEEDLRRARSELEERVAQRTADLIRAQRQLAETKRLSDIGELSATVAHELRNPLGVIRAAAFNVRRKNPDPELGKHLDRIDKKILESDQIINNLLFYSRIKVSNFENTSLYDILSECIVEAAIKFKGQNIRVKKNLRSIKGKMIEADAAQLREVFNNLLGNAYDAVAGKKGLIEVRGLFDEAERRVKISIADNGCGIDPGLLSRIMEPFFTTKSQGTGLGLAVCSQIVRLHNGKIEVTSRKNEGSVFTVIMPEKQLPGKAE